MRLYNRLVKRDNLLPTYTARSEKEGLVVQKNSAFFGISHFLCLPTLTFLISKSTFLHSMSDKKPCPVDDTPKAKRRKQDDSALEKPKRPLSAYNLFFREERSRYLEERAERKGQDTSGKSPFLAMSAEISKRWMSLPLDQRQKYNEMAEEETRKYHVKVDAYKAKQRGLSSPTANRGERERSQADDDHTLLSNLTSQSAQAASYGTGGPAPFPRRSMISSSMMSPQLPSSSSSAVYASPNREDNILLQGLVHQQLESTSGLQSSLQQQLLRQLSSIPTEMGLDVAALRRYASREAAALHDDTAQLRALLEMEERIRQQQITDILEQELHRRTSLLSQQANRVRNPLLQRQGQTISFLPPSGTDINNTLFSQARLLSRGDQLLQERLFRGEAKEASPFRQVGTSTAGVSIDTGDDLLLRALLANQMQQGPALSSNRPIPAGIESSLAQQQHALHGDPQLIAALAQGLTAPNADDDPQDSSNPSSPS
jgi:hypothetical protein